jgi:2-methylaconitate cis-trans-isomerase PrpF
VFFLENDLPTDRSAIEAILLDVFGSPDVRQIDGLGGATSQTSKAAIIGPSTRADADVDYTFAQVSVTDALVDWGGNCGNISAAVGPFAIDQGLVRASGDVTTVRIHNTNTSKVIVAHVPTVGGRASIEGEYSIPGVPGTGARILLDFDDPAGSVTGKLLPTGSPCDELVLADGRRITVSVVDAANPTVFLRASDLGLSGTELPSVIEANTAVTATLEEARSIIAERLGLVADKRQATTVSPGLPKVGFVAPPQDCSTADGGSGDHARHPRVRRGPAARRPARGIDHPDRAPVRRHARRRPGQRPRRPGHDQGHRRGADSAPHPRRTGVGAAAGHSGQMTRPRPRI